MRRLEFLDSLRGIAAVYIAIYHTILIPNPHLEVPDWAAAVALNGGTAVTLFFVVSAFSLCHAMRAHQGEPRAVTAFYVRRFFRIAPLFYSVIAFYLLRDWVYFGAFHTPWEVAASVLFLFNFLPGWETGIVWASWTIGVEMAFYLVFPFLFRRCDNLATISAVFFAGLLGALVFHQMLFGLSGSAELRETFFQFSFFRHLPVFIFGILAYLIFEQLISRRVLRPAVGAALILTSLYAYHALLHGSLNIGFTDSYYWQAIVYGTLLIGLSICPSPVFVNRITQFFGRVSYSVYLFHPFTIVFLFPVYPHIAELPLSITARFLISIGLTVAIVLLLAYVGYHLIEKPGMRLGKRLLEHRRIDWNRRKWVPARDEV